MLRPPVLPQMADSVLQRGFDALKKTLTDIVSSPVIDGRLVQKVALVSGSTNAVNHGLGRTLIGWAVVRSRGQSTVWDGQDSNTTPALTLSLLCSANVTVDLWVF